MTGKIVYLKSQEVEKQEQELARLKIIIKHFSALDDVETVFRSWENGCISHDEFRTRMNNTLAPIYGRIG